MLSIKNLSINLPKNICTNLNIQLPLGSRLAVIGRNGIGKTTFLENLLTLKNLYIDELPLNSYKNNIQKLISYSSQSHNFYPYIKVQELFKFIYIDREAIKKYLDVFEIPNIYLIDLSSGEKQIIFNLMAILQSTKILLLDEPTSNLDWINSVQIFEILLQQQKYIICATHDIHNLKYFTHILELQPNGQWKFSQQE